MSGIWSYPFNALHEWDSYSLVAIKRHNTGRRVRLGIHQSEYRLRTHSAALHISHNLRYGDIAGNTVEENSSIFSLI